MKHKNHSKMKPMEKMKDHDKKMGTSCQDCKHGMKDSMMTNGKKNK